MLAKSWSPTIKLARMNPTWKYAFWCSKLGYKRTILKTSLADDGHFEIDFTGFDYRMNSSGLQCSHTIMWWLFFDRSKLLSTIRYFWNCHNPRVKGEYFTETGTNGAIEQVWRFQCFCSNTTGSATIGNLKYSRPELRIGDSAYEYSLAF